MILKIMIIIILLLSPSLFFCVCVVNVDGCTIFDSLR